MPWTIVIDIFGQLGDSAVTCISEEEEWLELCIDVQGIVAYPPNQTFLPPLSTAQLAHRVAALSKGPRPLVC
jgi:hypothetical protein